MTIADMLIQRGMQQGIEQGIQQGIGQGIQQGIGQGEVNKAHKIAINMLKKDYSVEEVLEATELSKAEVKKLKKQIILH